MKKGKLTMEEVSKLKPYSKKTTEDFSNSTLLKDEKKIGMYYKPSFINGSLNIEVLVAKDVILPG